MIEVIQMSKFWREHLAEAKETYEMGEHVGLLHGLLLEGDERIQQLEANQRAESCVWKHTLTGWASTNPDHPSAVTRHFPRYCYYCGGNLAAFIIAMGLVAGLGWIGDSYRYGIDKQCEQHQGGGQDG
jgi:hypothetical protein